MLAACRTSPAPRVDSAEAWPEADELFHRDASFAGGDSAYSVRIDDERVLWLFGDSFFGEGEPGSRAGRDMVRNVVAVQEGHDPSAAGFQVYAGESAAGFFTLDEVGEERWLWPGPAVNVDGALLLLLSVIERREGGLGFESVGSRAVLVEDPAGAPSSWILRPLAVPEAPAGVLFGLGAATVDDGVVYGLAPREPGNHDLYLWRIDVEDARQGDLSRVRWHSREGRFGAAEAANVVVANAQTELSLHRRGDDWLLVEVNGFGAVDVVIRGADVPWGPWSGRELLYRPPESAREGVLVYSAKAHPELGDGHDELVVTYCTNHVDFWTLAADTTLYFPRFVRARVTLE